MRTKCTDVTGLSPETLESMGLVERANDVIHVRVSKVRKDRFVEAAKRSKLSLSEWVLAAMDHKLLLQEAAESQKRAKRKRS